MIDTPKKVNYLNNKDILKEIHLSKTSYCSFLDDTHRYDVIVDSPDSPLTESFTHAMSLLSLAKENRAARLSAENNTKVDPNSINNQDVVFRIMTWDHIPISTKKIKKVEKKQTAKDILEFDEGPESFTDLEDPSTAKEVDDMVHTKVNFPPFQHYKINENGSFYCVGKSHWKGDLDSGEFCKDHGQITKTLAKMYIMLCEKYAMKYNWRGYTYNEEMRNSAILQLTYVGLRFNEAKSANPFAFYTAVITNSFCRVLNTEKRSQNIRDDILEMNGLNPSWSRQGSSGIHFEE